MHREGGLYTRGLLHGRHFGFVIAVFIVHLYKHEKKQKLACSDKQTNTHYYRYNIVYLKSKLIFGGGGLYSGRVIFGKAYIWNGVNVSNLIGL